MARSDNDTWHAASAIGVSRRDDARYGPSPATPRIINDPLAERLVKAIRHRGVRPVIDGKIAPTEIGDDPHYSLSHLIGSMTIRTRFFDDFFAAAADAGIRQAVILASGLDARAYRLPWPDGAVVYEIDRAPVTDRVQDADAVAGGRQPASRAPADCYGSARRLG